jgi:hypothetical protein
MGDRTTAQFECATRVLTNIDRWHRVIAENIGHAFTMGDVPERDK